MGPKASQSNDDNLNILQGNSELAIQYAVNVLSVYDHFHWRYSLAQNNDPSKTYKGLTTDTAWMKNYLVGDNENELKFMLSQKQDQTASNGNTDGKT